MLYPIRAVAFHGLKCVFQGSNCIVRVKSVLGRSPDKSLNLKMRLKPKDFDANWIVDLGFQT